MAWIPICDPIEPYILDDNTGEVVATFPLGSRRHDEAWSAACVMSLAPDLHRKLSDLSEHGKRNFATPELHREVRDAFNLINNVRFLYESRRVNT